MTIKLYTSTTHHQQTKAVLTEAEIHELLAQAVAAQAGIDLAAPGVTWRAFITSRNGSTGSEKSAEVVITQDMSQADKPAFEPHVFSGSVRAPIKAGDTIEWDNLGQPLRGHVQPGADPDRLVVRAGSVLMMLEDVIEEADPDTLKIIG